MGSKDVRSFYFAGEPEVGACLEASLKVAGFVPAKLSESDVVFTYCISESSLEDLYYDASGVLQKSKKDAILVDLSPSTVSFAQELCAMGSVGEKHVLDAPLVVRDILSPEAFSHPEGLGVLVGGAEKIYKRVEPMLRAVARRVLWVGRSGCGQSAKIALTLSSAASLVGLVEAITSLKISKTDFDIEDYLDVAQSFSALTPAQEEFVQALGEDECDRSAFTIEYMMGELSAALTSVDDDDLILPQAEAGFRLMELLAIVGGATLPPAALKLVFADEETGKKYNLDWSRAEGAYDHDEHACDCDDDCEGDCDCGHHHGHSDATGLISFSSN